MHIQQTPSIGSPENGTAPDSPSDHQGASTSGQSVPCETVISHDFDSLHSGISKPLTKAQKLLQDAQIESINELTKARLLLLDAQYGLDAVRGEDDYQQSLLDVVRAYGSDGITSVKLQVAFGDSVKLGKARTALVEKRLITVNKEGQSFRLTSIPV